MSNSASSYRSQRGKTCRLLSIALLAMISNAAFATQAALPDFQQLVAERSPAVVNIRTRTQVPSTPSRPEFHQRFRNFQGPQPPAPRGTPQGIGSGVIASPDGYILTNSHVVEHATEIVVQLSDQRELSATLVGRDAHTDVAILKVDATNLPAAKFGDSDKLNVGEWVLAIGAPFGLEQTATQGIVSAVSRSLPNDSYVPFIQTDVALNPGNSGGPLFNLAGEVIGINSQIFSRTGGYMGLSFAIPINLVSAIADQLKTGNQIQRGWLGIAIQDMNQNLAESFGLTNTKGALISAITPGGPAATAALQAGDVIVEYDGHPIERSAALPPLVAATPVNRATEIRIIRAGIAKTVTVSVGLLAALNELREPATTGPLGLVVSDITRSDREDSGVQNGVRVEQVEPDKPGAVAGLQPNDIIIAFDRQTVDNVAELTQLADHPKPGSTVSILVQRQRQTQFLALRIPIDQTG